MAALTPSVVQKSTEQVQDGITGTPVRITKFKLKATKAAQNDTIVLPTYIGSAYTADKVISMHGIVIPAATLDSVQETLSIDDSDDEVVLAGATTGTAWVTIEITE